MLQQLAAGRHTEARFKELKLTQLLQPWLAPRGALWLLAAVSAAAEQRAEAQRTLQFATLLDATPDALLLDVQDPGSEMIKGSHSASLGTLPFKASTDLAEFKDPTIADRPKDALIIVNCGLGGQALLGAKLLLDYGFTNVKTIQGGCVAYNKAAPGKKKNC